MSVKTILNHCYKFKSFIYKSVYFTTDYNGIPIIIVDIAPRANGKKLCSKCQSECPGYDRLKSRDYKFVPLWGIPVFFRYARRRVNCSVHGVVAEYIPWADGKSHLTNVFKLFLAHWAKYLSWSTVAEKFKVQWYHVFESVEWVVEYGLKNRCLDKIKAIGIDEIQYRVGHVYLTLVYQIDSHCRRLLYVGKERTAKTLLRFFHVFGKVRTSALAVVCSDMWKPYLKVIAKKVPQAIHILDRFHIMKKFNEAIDNTRRKEKRASEGTELEPILKHSRWCLLKNKKKSERIAISKA